jgi:hypothetical protein
MRSFEVGPSPVPSDRQSQLLSKCVRRHCRTDRLWRCHRSSSRITIADGNGASRAELDSHDLIIAEGAASETFVDDDSRGMFQNAQEYSLLYPESQSHGPRLYSECEVEAARRAINARAGLKHARPVDQPPRGFVDIIAADQMSGWAQNPDRPEVPVCLDVLVDGQVIGQTLANIYREDLAKAGFSSGRHSFEFSLDAAIVSARQSVTVQRLADGVALGMIVLVEPHAA